MTPQAVELGWAAFGPMIGSAVALLRGFDEVEVAAVRRFLQGFHTAVSGPDTGPAEASGPDTDPVERTAEASGPPDAGAHAGTHRRAVRPS